MQVNMLEAKNQLSKLVKAAQAGEEVIIANHGSPAVRLVPVEPSEMARSLAAEMSELRSMMRKEHYTLPETPQRTDRANPFLEHLAGTDAAD